MTNLILEASRFAERHHRGQFRKYNGKPYITHPARVAARVSFYDHTSENMVAAAWLHDVIEDCNVSPQSILDSFNKEIHDLVVALTNPSKQYPHFKRAARKAMDIEHIETIPTEAKVIKMYDRIDNLLETLEDIHIKESYDFVRTVYFKESLALYDVVKDADYWVGNEFAQTLEKIHKSFEIGD